MKFTNLFHGRGIFLSIPFVISVLFFSSCTSLEKLTLMQNTEKSNTGSIQIEAPSVEYILRPGDLITLDVKSPDPTLVDFFNLRSSVNPTSITEQSVYLNSYLINDNGAIDIPEIGIINITGLSVQQAEDLIEKELGSFLKSVFVMIKVTNLQVSVFGEVSKPGTYSVTNNAMSIVKALSMAGDITDYGNRKRVLVIRRNGDAMEYGIVDLTNIESFKSPWYWVRPGDEIYVEPTRLKSVELNTSPARTALLVLTNALVIFRLFN